MLDTLSIKNFAIIEDIEVNFHKGMSVLLGETGAGKSIIIEAISLLKGERSTFEKIRNNATKAYIEGRFLIENTDLIRELNEEYEDLIIDNELIVTRTLDTTGRTSIRLNGRMFSASATKAIMTEIIDIHSQHQNLMLLDECNHMPLLDKYIGKHELFLAYGECYKKYKLEQSVLSDLEKKVIDEDAIVHMKNQIEEIELLGLAHGELEELENIQRKMANFIKLQDAVSRITNLLEGEDGATGKIYQARRELDYLNDSDYDVHSTKLNDVFYELQDIASFLNNALAALNEYEYSADFLSDRIYTIKKLMRRYGSEEEDIFKAHKRLHDELLLVTDYTYYLEKQTIIVKELEEKLFNIGNELSTLRKEKAMELETLVDAQLADLSLNNAHFRVEFKRSSFKENGLDEIVFLLSANIGTPYAPLKSIISGGEASRLMLGLKAIFTKYSNVETLIFDEVDSGVSGKVATQVGKKMHDIGKDRQVLVISHLAQVAAFSNHGYFVRKIIEGNETKTQISDLNDTEFVEQVASLLSGEEITSSSIAVARELIKKTKTSC